MAFPIPTNLRSPVEPISRKPISAPLLAGLLAAAVALLFALYTQHAWEDYYITYRASKNLATGHGLVFNVGDRLHTFTSPLGVLLPAVASLLTANSSDPAALWIFRLMCITALGGAAALLVRLAPRQQLAPVALLFLVAWFVTDAKTVDFTINGMETAFMLLFLAYAFWAHASPGPRQVRHLGAAWAGLMWTRPDSFIYIGLVAAGFWLFHDARRSGTTRAALLGIYLRAGLVTTALYLPWLLFAHFYYGTAVPHTIAAKSGLSGPHSAGGLLLTALRAPFTSGDYGNTLSHTFLPSYFILGGWPAPLVTAARAVGVLCSVVWLLPRQHVATRAASFAFLGAHTYLQYFPYFPFPWYMPSTALLAFVTLAGLASRLAEFTAAGWRRWLGRGVLLPLAVVLLAGSTWTLVQSARQLRAQQKYIEEGTRRQIGEWLHAHAQPGDSVFMEPLGYIGFFSGLKTYDFPGMSSREMVEARKKVQNDWGALIQYLQPNWLVLRPQEIARINTRAPDLLPLRYTLIKEFSVRDRVRELTVSGKGYLAYDETFTVYHLTRKMTYRSEIEELTSEFPTSRQVIDGRGVSLVHAPGRMVVKVPANTALMEVDYGFPPGAYTGEGDLTDGATFRIEWSGDGRTETLLDVYLDPVGDPAQRTLQHFRGELPATKDAEARLIFSTLPGSTRTKDWTCWSLPGLYETQ